jgi:drug/metabolite transporter (DMT)-like permease
MSLPTSPTPLRMGPFEWGLLILLSIIWGGSFLFGRIAVQEVPPLTVAWLRVLLAAIVLAGVIAVLRYRWPASLTAWLPFLVMGLLNNVIPFSLILWGQKEIGSGLASILNATTPLFAAVIAHLLTDDEKLTANKVLGVLIGLAGVAILVGPTALGNLGGHGLAELAVLGAAVSYGFAGWWGRRLRSYPPIVSAGSQLICSSAIMTAFAVTLDQPWHLPMPSAAAIGAIVGLALLCTAIAYIIFFTIIARAGSTNVLLVTLLIPPSAMVMGAMFLNETLAWDDLIGALAIGLALVIIDGRAWRWLMGRTALG